MNITKEDLNNLNDEELMEILASLKTLEESLNSNDDKGDKNE